MYDTNDKHESLSETDFIDSVKEVDMNIRSHRDDDDFEKMFAMLNKKSNQTHEENAEVQEPKSEPKAVAAMAEVAATETVGQAESEPKSDKQGSEAEKSEAVSEAEEVLQAGESAPSEESEAAEEVPLERPLFENLESVWGNPGLMNGGRISMNIKTDFRREVTITVPVRSEQNREAKSESEEKSDGKTKSFTAIKKSKEQLEPITDFEHRTIELNTLKEPVRKKTAANNKAKKPEKHEPDPAKVRSAGRFAALNSAVCMAIIFCVGFYLLASGRDMSDFPKPSVETVTDGSYFDGISQWYTDTTPGADKLKAVSGGFARLLGAEKNSDGSAVSEADSDSGRDENADSSSEAVEAVNDSAAETASEQEEFSEEYYDDKFSGKAISGMDNVGESAITAMRRAQNNGMDLE